MHAQLVSESKKVWVPQLMLCSGGNDSFGNFKKIACCDLRRLVGGLAQISRDCKFVRDGAAVDDDRIDGGKARSPEVL